MKTIPIKYTKLIFLLFFTFFISGASHIEAQIESVFFSPVNKTTVAPQKLFVVFPVQKKELKQSKKERRKELKKQRKQFRKWRKANRKKLGLSLGFLGIFGLLGWRKKLKKLKKKSNREGLKGYGEGGCMQIFLFLVGIALVSLLGRWLLETIFGVMVGFWAGALLGFLALGIIVGLIWLIAKN